MNRCWVWDGTKVSGYGRAWVDGRMQLVHRASYETLVGPIPDGLEIDHLCRNRACYNPAHLEPVTRSVNIQRGMPYREVKTHCPQGHPYSGENLYVYADGRRACQACNRAKCKARYHAKRAA